jgi:DedD protein
MEFALKQRLVGAAVIIALAVVFIPMLLKGTGKQAIREIPPPPIPSRSINESLDIDKSIPLPPEKSSSLAIPEVPEDSNTASAAVKEAVDEKAATGVEEVKKAMAPIQKQAAAAAMEVTKKPPVTATGLEAWVVQIASFNDKDKAQALRDKLRKQGFNAFLESVAAKDKHAMYRVRVGPEPERKEADKLLKLLQEKTRLKGFVTAYP